MKCEVCEKEVTGKYSGECKTCGRVLCEDCGDVLHDTCGDCRDNEKGRGKETGA